MKTVALLCLVPVVFSAVLTTPKTGCVVKKADIGFIVDASGSVSAADWKKSLLFISRLVQDYEIGADDVKVGLIQFSSSARLEFNFNKFSSLQALQQSIVATKKVSGGTNTASSLDLARTKLFTTAQGMRQNVPNLLFVITDGKSNAGNKVGQASKKLHNMGITVFAVGVAGANEAELKLIASNPSYVYKYTDYSKLASIQSKFSSEACKVIVEKIITAPPVTTPEPCVVKKADIGFIVDASGSVSSTDWQKSLTFVSRIIRNYNISADGVRVGLIQFSSASTMEFNFNKYKSLQSMQQRILSIPQKGGNTNTPSALNLARTTLFTTAQGMRPNVPNLLFVLTDGQSNQGGSVPEAAKKLHNMGITVFAVGVANANAQELSAIASQPNYVYTYNDYSKLAQIQDQFAKQACDVIVNRVDTSRSCRVNKADIVFVVDTSSSVGKSNFEVTKLFLNSMINNLDFQTNRVGVIKFNDKVTPEFELKDLNNLQQSSTAINAMQYNSGQGTVISKAITYMREKSFTANNGDRAQVPNVAVLVTDGQAKDPYRTQYEANKTKAEGITLFTVGIGSFVNQKELRTLATLPSYFFPVKDFSQLKTIIDQLSNGLCQGFTIPATTTAATCYCRDKDDNCAGYGRSMCLEAGYRKFAQDTCPLYCDLCPPGCIIELKPPKPCIDKIPDCNNKIGVCTNPSFASYALENCPKYCKLCEKLKPTPRWTQPPTTTTTTTTTPTTTTGRVPVTPTTPYTICDVNCYDKSRDCSTYNRADCKLPTYKTFFQNNCALYCGYCTPKASCISNVCEDAIDCSGYSNDACVDYKDWALTNCKRRCGLCPGQTPVTKAPPPTACRDLEDCTVYGRDFCTDYKTFAQNKCPLYCGFCQPLSTTPKPPCTDKQDCTNYRKEFCTSPDYRSFMLENCRKYCDLCDADI